MTPRYHTKQYPLQTTTIDESTTENQPKTMQNSAYVKQLKMKPEDLEDMTVPSINDQATNSHIWASQAEWTEDTNNFN